MVRLVAFPAYVTVLSVTMLAFHTWPASPIVVTLSIALGGWGVLHILYGVVIGGAAASLWTDIRDVVRKLRSYRQLSVSPHITFNRWTRYCGSLILAQSLLLEITWLGIALCLLGYSMFHSLRFLQPPFALVLGVSDFGGRDTLRIVDRAVSPFQTSHLLHIENRDLRDAVVKGSSHRLISASNDWKEAVRVLAEVCKIIVVDVRGLSDAVQEELNLLIAMDVFFKVVFVVDSAMESAFKLLPLDAQMLMESQSKRVTIEHLGSFVTHLRKNPELLPTRRVPLSTSHCVPE